MSARPCFLFLELSMTISENSVKILLDGAEELIQKIRSHEDYKYIPLVMLTTESQSQKKLEGKSVGATGWIVKPFQPDQLVGVVKRVLG